MGKGPIFERSICKKLSQWWSGDPEEDDIFWRTHGSGARATVRSKRGKRTHGQDGDVCAVDFRGRTLTKVCTISLKKGYKGVNLSDFLDATPRNAESQLAQWIREAERDRLSAGVKAWLIIYQKDRRNAVVCMSHEFFKQLHYIGSQLALELPAPHAMFRVPINKSSKLKAAALKRLNDKGIKPKATDTFIFACQLDDFLRLVTKHEIKLIYKRMRLDKDAKSTDRKKFPKSEKNKDKISQKRDRSRRRQRSRKKHRRKSSKMGRSK